MCAVGVAASLASLGPLLAGALYSRRYGPGTVLVFAGWIGAAAVLATFSAGSRNMCEISAST